MKIILSQNVNVKDKISPHILFKDFESSAIPHPDCLITDTIWDNPCTYRVLKVVINYQDNECYVSLADFHYVVDDLEEYRKIAERHGWRIVI